MRKELLKSLINIDLEAPADAEQIALAEAEMGIVFPVEYKAFMLEHNGGEGPVGENGYLALWKIEELAELNKDYCIQEFTPGLYAFGSDGGGMEYAFDMRDDRKAIIEIPFESIHIEEAAVISESFNGFLEALYRK